METGARHILLAWHFQSGSRSGLRNALLIAASHCFPPFPPAGITRQLNNKKQRTSAWSQPSGTHHHITGRDEARFGCPSTMLIPACKESARFLRELWERE